MSELCLSSNPNTAQISTLLLSHLLLFFSFILSHPLYFSYLVFFSPSLLKFLSFLSPVFITTSLLLLALLTLSPTLVHHNPPQEFSQSKLGFLLSACHAVTERLRSSKTDNEEDDEFRHFEELEAFKIVFDNASSTFYAGEKADQVFEFKSEKENCFRAVESPLLKSSIDECSGLSTFGSLFADFEERTVEIDWEETNDQPIKETERLEGFLKELDEFENMIYSVEEKKKAEPPSTKSDKVEANKEGQSEAITVKASSDNEGEREYNSSKVETNSQRVHSNNVDSTDNGGEYTSKLLESPSSWTLDSSIGSYGSMRREKEWKRTLACKLFEERHNVDGGGEGMDLLWETEEVDSSNKAKPKRKNMKKKKKKKNKKKGGSEYYDDDDDGDDDDDDEEEEDMDAQLCCLQALKFSAGKMNLGMGMGMRMGRPNLVKISKAFKGIGWFYNVTKHGKKGYN